MNHDDCVVTDQDQCEDPCTLETEVLAGITEIRDELRELQRAIDSLYAAFEDKGTNRGCYERSGLVNGNP